MMTMTRKKKIRKKTVLVAAVKMKKTIGIKETRKVMIEMKEKVIIVIKMKKKVAIGLLKKKRPRASA